MSITYNWEYKEDNIFRYFEVDNIKAAPSSFRFSEYVYFKVHKIKSPCSLVGYILQVHTSYDIFKYFTSAISGVHLIFQMLGNLIK